MINDIYTHYSDGISGGAGAYFHDVTNDNPIIYLRMDAPAYNAPALGGWPTLQNYGTTNGVAVGNGVYTPGTLPGVLTNLIANPNGVPFGGVSNTVAGLSGVSSFGDAGSVLAYNPTGSNANFAVTALFRGNPCDNRVQSIVGHGTNSWQLTVTTNGAWCSTPETVTRPQVEPARRPGTSGRSGSITTASGIRWWRSTRRMSSPFTWMGCWTPTERPAVSRRRI